MDTCWFNSDTVEVFISNPQPTIIDTGGYLSTQWYASYQWYFNGQIIPGGTNGAFAPIDNGCYYVVIINEWGCVGQSDVYGVGVNCNTSIGNLVDTKFSLYPNPATNQVTFELEHPLGNGQLLVDIFSATGQLVYSLPFDYAQGDNMTINTESFPKGLYFFKVRAGNEVLVRKVIIN